MIKPKILAGAFSILIWIALYPGYFSSDSLNSVKDLGDLNFNGGQGVVWSIYVFISSLFGFSPALSTLTGLIILNLSIIYFCNIFCDTRQNFTVIAILAMPSTWSFGLTLWHDVTFSAGMLIALALLKKSNTFANNLTHKDFLLFLSSNFLLLTRLNGVIFCVVFLSIFMWNKRNQLHQNEKSLIIILFLGILVAIQLVGSTKQEQVLRSGQYFMRADISCIAAKKAHLLNSVLTVDEVAAWKSAQACSWFNTSQIELSQENLRTVEISRIYFYLFINHPEELLRVHWDRNGYIFDPIGSLKTPAPFIHSHNDWNQSRGLLGEKTFTLFNDLSRIANLLRGIVANSGFFALTILLLFVFRYKSLRYCVAFGSALSLLMFVIAPHPDTRFIFANVLIGQIILTNLFVKLFNRFHPFNLLGKSRLKVKSFRKI